MDDLKPIYEDDEEGSPTSLMGRSNKVKGKKVVFAEHVDKLIMGEEAEEGDNLFQDPTCGLMRDLPASLHAFRDPRHEELLQNIEDKRILILSSFREIAATSAAYSLIFDKRFDSHEKRALFPSRPSLAERTDLHIDLITRSEMIRPGPEVLLIEIDRKCLFLDSVLLGAPSYAQLIRSTLKARHSCLVLVVDSALLSDEFLKNQSDRLFAFHTISHISYLLSSLSPQHAADFESRFLVCVERHIVDPVELHESIPKRLAEGIDSLERYLAQIEGSIDLGPSDWLAQFRPVRPEEILREESEVHRVAGYVGTYFPGVGQRDFDRLVLLLLGEQKHRVENERQLVESDGTVRILRECHDELWSDSWQRMADRVFRDCHLRPVPASNGSWSVDFVEPYLRRELQVYFDSYLPWYSRQQCKRLQDSGILFAADLSEPAIEGLVRLFICQAVADPYGFGSSWLSDLILSVRIELRAQLQGDPPSGSPEDRMGWLIEQLTVAVQLRAHFHSRLARLVRAMLEREVLRPMVKSFFDSLIAVRKHESLLDLVLDLARRLRFAPHFDALNWMRRLLDQGSSEMVRRRTANRLLGLAEESGLRVFEFFAAIRAWMPELNITPERFSPSNRFALSFPFSFCMQVAIRLPEEGFGTWPSPHPLFAALPSDNELLRNQIRSLIEWLLDPRGVSQEKADPADRTITAEVVRVNQIGELVEHWAWVLEGEADTGAQQGRELFRILLEILSKTASGRERASLLRFWQRRQDDYFREAANEPNSRSAQRTMLARRRTKLGMLRERFVELANGQG